MSRAISGNLRLSDGYINSAESRQSVQLSSSSESRIRKGYDEALNEAKNFFLRKIKNVKAIYCVGSAARGDPGPHSDIDITIVSNRSVPRRRRWYAGYFNDCLILALRIDEKDFLKSYLSRYEPRFFWRFSTFQDCRVLYDPANLISRTVRKMNKMRNDPVAQEFVVQHRYPQMLEYLGKMRNAIISKDHIMVKYAARVLAETVGEILVAINRIQVRTENTFVRQVLKAETRPEGFNRDFIEAYGYGSKASNHLTVANAALRLARNTHSLVKKKFLRKSSGNLRRLLTAQETEALLSS